MVGIVAILDRAQAPNRAVSQEIGARFCGSSCPCNKRCIKKLRVYIEARDSWKLPCLRLWLNKS